MEPMHLVAMAHQTRRKEESDADLRQPAELDRPGYQKGEGDDQAVANEAHSKQGTA